MVSDVVISFQQHCVIYVRWKRQAQQIDHDLKDSSLDYTLHSIGDAV